MLILVAGGRGYVGFRLAHYLSSRGHEVVIGTRKSFPNYQGALGKNISQIQIDWTSRKSLEHATKGMDLVVQAAGMNAEDCCKNPVEALEINGAATARIAEACVSTNVRRLIYLSTAHVYGNRFSGKITEKTPTLNLHPYATSHIAGESHVKWLNAEKKIEGVVVRLSNSFGLPYSRNKECWKLFVNDICKQAVQNGRIQLKSNSQQRRDFISMTDVVRIIGHLGQINLGQYSESVFNVGSGWAPTLEEMAKLVQSRCKVKFGYFPKIFYSEEDNNIINNFEYSGNYIKSSGINFKENIINEIDCILNYLKC